MLPFYYTDPTPLGYTRINSNDENIVVESFISK
jgi:hypothetical protein